MVKRYELIDYTKQKKSRDSICWQTDKAPALRLFLYYAFSLFESFRLSNCVVNNRCSIKY